MRSDPTNGCEANLSSDPAHCGACGSACSLPNAVPACAAGACATLCPRGPSADATCTGGTCGITCIAPYADCDGAPGNLCERNLQTSASDCGACGTACGGTRVCCAGACARGPCP